MIYWYCDRKVGAKTMGEERPLVTYQKNAEIGKNRVIIPKFFIDNNGREFYMEVYKDKIVLKPIRKEN